MTMSSSLQHHIGIGLAAIGLCALAAIGVLEALGWHAGLKR